jgi:SAM-dependent methyltransferase
MNVDGFDRWAPYYDNGALQTLLYHPMHERLLHRVAALRPYPRRLLDLGCGTGRLLAAAAHRFPGTTLAGADACGAMLDAAAAHLTPAHLVQAQAEHLPFPDSTFDVITCTATVRHWHDLHRGMAEAARVLTDGGVLAVADFFVLRPRSAWWPRSAGVRLPVAIEDAIGAAGLRPTAVRAVEGYGPVANVTTALAINGTSSTAGHVRRHGRYARVEPARLSWTLGRASDRTGAGPGG